MISLNIEREMKLEAIAKWLKTYSMIKLIMHPKYKIMANELLNILDNLELSTQEAWMAEERKNKSNIKSNVCSLCNNTGKISKTGQSDNMDVYEEDCPECLEERLREAEMTAIYSREAC